MSLKGHSSLIFFLNEKRATHPMLPNLRSCFGPLQKTDFGGVGWGAGGAITAPPRHTTWCWSIAGNTVHQGQFNSPVNWMCMSLTCANSPEHLGRWGRRHPHKLQPLQILRHGANAMLNCYSIFIEKKKQNLQTGYCMKVLLENVKKKKNKSAQWT